MYRVLRLSHGRSVQLEKPRVLGRAGDGASLCLQTYQRAARRGPDGLVPDERTMSRQFVIDRGKLRGDDPMNSPLFDPEIRREIERVFGPLDAEMIEDDIYFGGVKVTTGQFSFLPEDWRQ